jgi:hypothetical protein
MSRRIRDELLVQMRTVALFTERGDSAAADESQRYTENERDGYLGTGRTRLSDSGETGGTQDQEDQTGPSSGDARWARAENDRGHQGGAHQETEETRHHRIKCKKSGNSD